MAAPETSFEQYTLSFPPGTAGSTKCKTIAEKIAEVCPWLVIDTVAAYTSSEYDAYLKVDDNKPYGMGVRLRARPNNYGDVGGYYKNNNGIWTQATERGGVTEQYFYRTLADRQHDYLLSIHKIGSSYCRFVIFNYNLNASLQYRCFRFTDTNNELFAASSANALTTVESSAVHPMPATSHDIFNPVTNLSDFMDNPIDKMTAGEWNNDIYRLYPLITDFRTASRAYYDVKFDGAKLYILQKGSTNVALPSGTRYRVNGIEYTAIDGLCIVPLEVA